MATQNPLEQEGTYPLPEAQMDRFMFKIQVSYPSKKEELEILNKMGFNQKPVLSPVINRESLLKASARLDQIYVDAKIKNYIVDLVMATRHPKDYGLSRMADLISVGASPRATISLFRASKAQAFLRGRGFVTLEDVKSIMHLVLRHRLILNFEAEAENVTTDDVIKEILAEVEVV
jgi:MoxR-like ATPase